MCAATYSYSSPGHPPSARPPLAATSYDCLVAPTVNSFKDVHTGSPEVRISLYQAPPTAAAEPTQAKR